MLEMMGWHGMYLLFLIVAFKLFFPEQDDFLCPCTWFVAYGAIMLLLPSLTSYTIAVFAYFRQEDDSGPWEVLKSLYVFKFACNFHNNRSEWDFHVKRCIRCKLVERDWPLVKIAVSAILSLLYPLAWLSLSFLQSSYYVCTQVGPTNETLQNYCKVESTNMTKTNYTKAYGLAVIRSKALGSILFTSTLFLLGIFAIIYGEMKSYLIKRYDWTPRGSRLAKKQVNVRIIPSYSPGTLRAAKSEISRDITVARKEETAGIERQFQFPFQLPAGNASKVIKINVNSTFTETLQRYVNSGGIWERIEVHCCQQKEVTNCRGSLSSFSLPSRASRTAGPKGYQSFEQLIK